MRSGYLEDRGEDLDRALYSLPLLLPTFACVISTHKGPHGKAATPPNYSLGIGLVPHFEASPKVSLGGCRGWVCLPVLPSRPPH